MLEIDILRHKTINQPSYGKYTAYETKITYFPTNLSPYSIRSSISDQLKHDPEKWTLWIRYRAFRCFYKKLVKSDGKVIEACNFPRQVFFTSVFTRQKQLNQFMKKLLNMKLSPQGLELLYEFIEWKKHCSHLDNRFTISLESESPKTNQEHEQTETFTKSIHMTPINTIDFAKLDEEKEENQDRETSFEDERNNTESCVEDIPDTDSFSDEIVKLVTEERPEEELAGAENDDEVHEDSNQFRKSNHAQEDETFVKATEIVEKLENEVQLLNELEDEENQQRHDITCMETKDTEANVKSRANEDEEKLNQTAKDAKAEADLCDNSMIEHVTNHEEDEDEQEIPEKIEIETDDEYGEQIFESYEEEASVVKSDFDDVLSSKQELSFHESTKEMGLENAKFPLMESYDFQHHDTFPLNHNVALKIEAIERKCNSLKTTPVTKDKKLKKEFEIGSAKFNMESEMNNGSEEISTEIDLIKSVQDLKLIESNSSTYAHLLGNTSVSSQIHFINPTTFKNSILFDNLPKSVNGAMLSVFLLPTSCVSEPIRKVAENFVDNLINFTSHIQHRNIFAFINPTSLDCAYLFNNLPKSFDGIILSAQKSSKLRTISESSINFVENILQQSRDLLVKRKTLPKSVTRKSKKKKIKAWSEDDATSNEDFEQMKLKRHLAMKQKRNRRRAEKRKRYRRKSFGVHLTPFQ